MTFSLLVPVYNGERFINQCLDSVLPQLGPGDQLLVHDDGSTDKTPEILRSYGDRISVSYSKNRGVSHARNVLSRRSNADYLIFLDADDLIKSNGISIFREHFTRYRTDCALTPIFFFHENLEQQSHVFYKDAFDFKSDPLTFFIKLTPPAASLIVSRDLFVKVNGFCPWMRHSEEFDLVVKLIQQRASWSFISDVVRCNRIHDGVRASNNLKLCCWRNITVLHSIVKGRYYLDLTPVQKRELASSALSAGRLLFRLKYHRLARIALSFADRIRCDFGLSTSSMLDRFSRVLGSYNVECLRSLVNATLARNSFGQSKKAS